MRLKNKIADICLLPDGVDLFGIAPVERFSDLPEHIHPEKFLPKTASVIVIGSQLFEVLTRKLTIQNKIGEVSFRDFYNAHNETVINDLKQTGYRIARFLTNKGYPSINIGQDLTDYRTITAAFSFKDAAVKAGLGVIGKNRLLITPQYGPRVKLSAVLTQAPIQADPVMEKDFCKQCIICIKVCPSGALKADNEKDSPAFDRFKCCAFYEANNGCSLCMSKCPL